MPNPDVKEIRIFPSMAIGRFGSSDEPMDNYTVQPGDHVTSRPTLVPAETLKIDGGKITGVETPSAMRFRDAQSRIRPVCPFLEVWARFTDDGPYRPLTKDDVAPDRFVWRVDVANRKVQRRTRVANEADLVSATTIINGAVHISQQLNGTATNFLAGKSIPLSEVLYLEPTDDFPEIRLRFRPGSGRVYGFELNDFITTQEQIVYDTQKGTWQNYAPQRNDLSPTPSDTFRAGILDDSCDGIVEVSINGTSLSARARISAGPPDFAPDSFHVLTAEDLLKQMMFGPQAGAPSNEDERKELIEDVVGLMCRALETVRLMNTGRLNISYSGQRDPITGQTTGAYPTAQAAHPHVVNLHSSVLTAVSGLSSSDAQQFLNAKAFLPLLLGRHRPHTQTWDHQPATRQLMPAFMRGSDAGDLSITRRLVAEIQQAMQLDAPTPPPPMETGAPAAMRRMIVDLAPIGASSHFGIDAGGGQTLADLFSDPDRLMQYLRTADAKGQAAGPVQGQKLIQPGNPDGSVFLQLVSGINPTMNAIFSSYQSPVSSKNGIEVVRDWINALPVI